MHPSDHTQPILSALTTMIDGTTREQLHNSTPCAKWTVHDLINHVVGGGYMFAGALRGEALPDPSAPVPDLLGDDPQGAFRAAVAAFESSASMPGVMDRMVA